MVMYPTPQMRRPVNTMVSSGANPSNILFFLPVLPGIISGVVAGEKERTPHLPPFLGVCAVVVVDEFGYDLVERCFFVEFFRIFFGEVSPDAFEACFGSFGDCDFAESFGECHYP